MQHEWELNRHQNSNIAFQVSRGRCPDCREISYCIHNGFRRRIAGPAMASACGRETLDGGEALQLREMLERILA